MLNPKVFPKTHISVYVSNLEKSVSFYRHLFNMEATKVAPGYAKFELSQPALIISFVENPEKVQSQFGHLGIQLSSSEEVKAEHQRLEALGLTTREENNTTCCYAVQDKFWIQDPDGTHWEFYYFHSDVAFEAPGASMENACCTPSGEEKTKRSLRDLTGEACC